METPGLTKNAKTGITLNLYYYCQIVSEMRKLAENLRMETLIS